MTRENLRDIRALILDIDGVLWKDDHPIGDIARIFERIGSLNLRFVLATNNSTRSADQYVTQLKAFGAQVENWQIVNSAETVAVYLETNFSQGSSIYVIGEAGLIESISRHGFLVDTSLSQVVAVVVGLDRSLTYKKLRDATLLIRSGAAFIGSNPDKTLPTPEGLIPGAGAILSALETSTGVQPTILGKPNPEIFQVAMERLGSQPQETLVIGDRLETDIRGAQTSGCRTALVLSGVSTIEQAQAWRPQPDVIANDLNQIVFEILT